MNPGALIQGQCIVLAIKLVTPFVDSPRKRRKDISLGTDPVIEINI